MGPGLSEDTTWTREASGGSLQRAEMIWEFGWCISWTKRFSSLVRTGGRGEHGKPAKMPSRYEPLCWKRRAWLSHAVLTQSLAQLLNFMSQTPGPQLKQLRWWVEGLGAQQAHRCWAWPGAASYASLPSFGHLLHRCQWHGHGHAVPHRPCIPASSTVSLFL